MTAQGHPPVTDDADPPMLTDEDVLIATQAEFTAYRAEAGEYERELRAENRRLREALEENEMLRATLNNETAIKLQYEQALARIGYAIDRCEATDIARAALNGAPATEDAGR